MAKSTKIRPLAKLIDQNARPFWVIDPDGRLAFLSGHVGEWLGIDPEDLVGRTCVAGASISDDPLDHLAASLAPPPGFRQRGTASLTVQPVLKGIARADRPSSLETRYVRLGDDADALTLAVGGVFEDQVQDDSVDAAVALRQQLDSWRRHHAQRASEALIGTSRQSARMRTQATIAERVRSHIVIYSPPGCFAESIASSVHQSAQTGEPQATIDGPLMDAELLDASLTTLSHHLANSDTTTATAILRGLEETPVDAQIRLVEWVEQFEDRLRLIALSAPPPKLADDSQDDALVDAQAGESVAPAMADLLCGVSIQLAPLSQRVEDIPLIATAFLDRRRSAGEAVADRISRAALDALVLFPWPDNLRELDQAIRHAARTCRADSIGVEHLPLAVRSYRPNEKVPATKQTLDLDQAVATFEAELIRRTLDAAEGNRAEAARRLNVSRARLLRKLDAIDPQP
ncbi:MAG: helix-turn-helix domain-containing protein [Planctomycetota bacterium]